jgi:hypothetical protein
MDHAHVRRQQVADAVAGNGMRVAAAELHEVIVAIGCAACPIAAASPRASFPSRNSSMNFKRSVALMLDYHTPKCIRDCSKAAGDSRCGCGAPAGRDGSPWLIVARHHVAFRAPSTFARIAG